MKNPQQHPSVEIVEEALREGMQIESASISATDKIRLLDALSQTGLKNIVVGAFVSPKWVPQMANVDEVVAGFTPVAGVTYTALALNAQGHQRAAEYADKIVTQDRTERAESRIHLCDVFVQRNTARTVQDEIDALPKVIAAAQARGVTEAMMCVNAAWGSNWLGSFTEEQRMAAFELQYAAWSAAGIAVTAVQLGDPMSWNSPSAMASQIRALVTRFPSVTTFQLHLHNARGLALLSAYAAFTELDARHHLIVDTGLGGLGGCPYCGNGRYTRMIPTEDFVQLMLTEGVDLGIDLTKLIEAAVLAEEIVGHELWGAVSKAGPLPSPDELYPMDLPFIETLEQAQHFRLGSSAYQGAPSPWREPISSTARDALERAQSERRKQ